MFFRLPNRANKGSLKFKMERATARRHLGNPPHPIQHTLGDKPLPRPLSDCLNRVNKGSLKKYAKRIAQFLNTL
ncbi:hypothetical protein GCWU000324_01113 [Kingella oralis ATCC 51147]|uniref:Uncharacterized protein n=1 Tax=Kingella oralis ATCC 51147 TaxID=629741 RepID=C4GG46_9NEIS|nr:hypothetical protein GCWU000324_01113 [Kingella oralis ATCC 51147]